jgi:hypothetical protein
MNVAINNEILEIADDYKYPGVVFSQSKKKKYKKARDHLVEKQSTFYNVSFSIVNFAYIKILM